MHYRFIRELTLAVLGLSLACGSLAQQAQTDSLNTAPPVPSSADAPAAGSAQTASERFAVHGQATFLEQLTAPFHAPYSGPNSLSPRHGAETIDVTLFLGARLWSGAEAWINPEIDQGFGLDDTVGVAGFPSGAAYKVGRSHPYWRLQRLFVRQTIELGGERQPLDGIANQLGGFQSANRWVFTVGKISVPDIFDANQYAHDPRNDFFNWTAVDAGTFDYAADSWGFTAGAAAEWYRGTWALRAGVFDLSDVPNSETLDPGFREFQWLGEVEKRHELAGSPGKLLLTLFDTRGRMALLNDAVALAQSTGETLHETLVAVRRYRDRIGASLNLEQQLSSDLGMFARAGKARGNVETYEFTDVDRTISAGLSLKGKSWGRTDDNVGLAGIVNGISATRERFLNAGGLGILVGDGQLPHPGAEQILETYYRLAVAPWAQLTFDYQYVVNPAFNTQRGPVSIVAVRIHAQF
jgi:high affinity Mn2+ porin